MATVPMDTEKVAGCRALAAGVAGGSTGAAGAMPSPQG